MLFESKKYGTAEAAVKPAPPIPANFSAAVSFANAPPAAGATYGTS